VKLIQYDLHRSRHCAGSVSAWSGNYDVAAHVYLRLDDEQRQGCQSRSVVFLSDPPLVHLKRLSIIFITERYTDTGSDVDVADRLSASFPVKVVKGMAQRGAKALKAMDQLGLQSMGHLLGYE
jgi:hypothetical protein